MLSDFMQVLNNEWKHYTKNDYFSSHIQCSNIYLLSKQELKYNN
jgi:hypothetical protein